MGARPRLVVRAVVPPGYEARRALVRVKGGRSPAMCEPLEGWPRDAPGAYRRLWERRVWLEVKWPVEPDTCPVCLEGRHPSAMFARVCGHAVCATCVCARYGVAVASAAAGDRYVEPTCPLCRAVHPARVAPFEAGHGVDWIMYLRGLHGGNLALVGLRGGELARAVPPARNGQWRDCSGWDLATDRSGQLVRTGFEYAVCERYCPAVWLERMVARLAPS